MRSRSEKTRRTYYMWNFAIEDTVISPVFSFYYVKYWFYHKVSVQANVNPKLHASDWTRQSATEPVEQRVVQAAAVVEVGYLWQCSSEHAVAPEGVMLKCSDRCKPKTSAGWPRRPTGRRPEWQPAGHGQMKEWRMGSEDEEKKRTGEKGK